MSKVAHLPMIAVSLGDPGGIGGEITLKCLYDNDLRRNGRWIIIGEASALRNVIGNKYPFWTTRSASSVVGGSTSAARALAPAAEPGSVTFLDFDHLATLAPWPARPNAAAGEASFRFVERAIQLSKLDPGDPWHADAVVTAPINKESWSLAGHGKYPGHTELFAEAFAADRFAMMFHASPREPGDDRPDRLTPGLNVILATVHCPLREVPTRLTTKRVVDAIELGAATLDRLGTKSPRIGVCGLNPHAGEHGLLGHEDESIIAPAVAQAHATGINAVGPLPADTIFQGALAFPGQRPAEFDLVVAMYHDQGLIPLKTIAWDRAVNLTVGLPIVRTSPDHGTAFDIAGKGIADAGSMKAAMRLAVAMART